MKLHLIKNNKIDDFFKKPKNNYIKNQFEDNIYSINFLNQATDGYKNNYFYAVYWVDPKLQKLVGTSNLIYVPKEDKESINMRTSKKMLEIRDLFIFPEFRGQGLCNVFVDTMSKYLKKLKLCSLLKLDVLSNNEKAIKCYKKNNFKIIKNKDATEHINKNFINIYKYNPECTVYIMTKNI
jgi:ribosomal protein S18 acetylase RimI-like enzyme